MEVIIGVAVNVLCAFAGGVIGWKLCVFAGDKARKEMSHRMAILMHACGIRRGEIKAIMEVHLANDEEVVRVAKGIEARRDADRRIKEDSVG